MTVRLSILSAPVSARFAGKRPRARFDVLDMTIKTQLGREYFEPIEHTIFKVVGIHQSRECITFAFARTRYSETYWGFGHIVPCRGYLLRIGRQGTDK